MGKVVLELIPESPLRVGGIKPKGNFLGTVGYIPGSVLRGTLAEWFKIQGREGDIVPVVSETRFGNLFPAPREAHYALPFPLTALECKLHGGFRTEGGHGIRDSLLVACVYEELERLGARFPVPLLFRCRECGGRMEKVRGFCAYTSSGWRKVQISLGLQTKVALSRFRHVAQEGALYRIMGIRPKDGLVFLGRLSFQKEEQLRDLEAAVEHLGVGALTTRGFGRARLAVRDDVFPPLSERLRRFNEQLQTVWRDLLRLCWQAGEAKAIPERPYHTYFSLDLLSPGIFADASGLPSLVPVLELAGESLSPVFWATHRDFAGGWSTAWGLPKPTALAAAQGSTYVFKSSLGGHELIHLLKALESWGIGERTDEGFGEVVVCHPLHQEVMPV
uniref:CRISPR-associated RAMP protein Csx10 n=1 Tax=Candidatus Caldatribacterium californiense TaxID=1454726 RepID=A0A7V4DG00_9BACT